MALAQRLAAELARDCDVVYGLNASADSFYDAQGRVDANFRDCNGNVLERLRALGVASVEMESFYLPRRRTAPTCERATCADRGGEPGHEAVVDQNAFEAVEARAGRAVLRTVVALPADVPPPEPPAETGGGRLGSARHAN